MRADNFASIERVILPDGTPWLCPRQADAMMIWREIFDDHSYLSAAGDVPPGGIIFDVGAHTGLASLYFFRNIDGVRIFAFEPAADLYECLSINLGRYADQVKAIPLALGRQSATSAFTYYPDAPSQSGLFADLAKDCQATVAYLMNQGAAPDDAQYLSGSIHTPREEVVRVQTLSSVLEDMNVATVDLLKLDVERSELAILEGIADNDWERIKSVVMEVHDSNGRLARCRSLLEDRNFTLTVTQAPWLVNSELFNILARR